MAVCREMTGSFLDPMPVLTLITARARGPSAPLFPYNGRCLNADEFNVRLRALTKAAGISEDVTARSFRSGRRTDLQNAGLDKKIICWLGRWRSVKASEEYQRVNEDLHQLLPKSIHA